MKFEKKTTNKENSNIKYFLNKMLMLLLIFYVILDVSRIIPSSLLGFFF